MSSQCSMQWLHQSSRGSNRELHCLALNRVLCDILDDYDDDNDEEDNTDDANDAEDNSNGDDDNDEEDNSNDDDDAGDKGPGEEGLAHPPHNH